MRVVVGEFDQRADDEEEQVFVVKTVSVHEKYHHALPMTYDIALIEVDQHIRFGRFPFELLCFIMHSLFYYLVTFFPPGARVNPICLPLLDESIPPGTGCIVGGWGRIRESKKT